MGLAMTAFALPFHTAKPAGFSVIYVTPNRPAM
jgi:hypothetical protein